MSYFFTTTELEIGQKQELSGPEAGHILLARRSKFGDTFELQDPQGHRFSCKILEIKKHSFTYLVEKAVSVPPELKTSLTLYLGLIAEQALDISIQKSTELGVSRIVIFKAERSPVTLKTQKLPRWKRIAQEASKQCGRSRIPDIEIGNFADTVSQTHTPLFYMDQHAKKSFRDYSQECAKMQSLGLCIGPEGGWSEAELTLLKKTGQKSIKLGPFTLRAETAAVAALAQALAFIK